MTKAYTITSPRLFHKYFQKCLFIPWEHKYRPFSDMVWGKRIHIQISL